jgi:hypothetical protein
MLGYKLALPSSAMNTYWLRLYEEKIFFLLVRCGTIKTRRSQDPGFLNDFLNDSGNVPGSGPVLPFSLGDLLMPCARNHVRAAFAVAGAEDSLCDLLRGAEALFLAVFLAALTSGAGGIGGASLGDLRTDLL